jgi:hypothetical protein
MEEQAEIENAWNETRTNAQVQKVLAYLGVRPLSTSSGQHAQHCVMDTSASRRS